MTPCPIGIYEGRLGVGFSIVESDPTGRLSAWRIKSPIDFYGSCWGVRLLVLRGQPVRLTMGLPRGTIWATESVAKNQVGLYGPIT